MLHASLGSMKTQTSTMALFWVRFVQFGLALGTAVSLSLTVFFLAQGQADWVFTLVLLFTFEISSLADSKNRSESNVHQPKLR